MSVDTMEAALGRYGQETPTETPELLQTKLGELKEELAIVPEAKKKWYLRALETCPDECDDGFLLKHLRCEVFNVKPAAERVVAYWDKRIEIFGEAKAFLPMTLSGALKDDEKSLEIGFLRPTLEKDDAGRAILYVEPSRMPLDKDYDRHSMVRAFWYFNHAVLEDSEVQKKGVVIVANPKDAKQSQFDRKMAKMNMGSIRGCLPMRVAAIHICHPPFFFEIIFSFAKVFLGERLRKRVKVHSGDDVVDKLEVKFGITKSKIPTQMGGYNELDHIRWLEERRSSGL